MGSCCAAASGSKSSKSLVSAVYPKKGKRDKELDRLTTTVPEMDAKANKKRRKQLEKENKRKRQNGGSTFFSSKRGGGGVGGSASSPQAEFEESYQTEGLAHEDADGVFLPAMKVFGIELGVRSGGAYSSGALPSLSPSGAVLPDRESLSKLKEFVFANPVVRVPRVCRRIEEMIEFHLRKGWEKHVELGLLIIRELVEEAALGSQTISMHAAPEKEKGKGAACSKGDSSANQSRGDNPSANYHSHTAPTVDQYVPCVVSVVFLLLRESSKISAVVSLMQLADQYEDEARLASERELAHQEKHRQHTGAIDTHNGLSAGRDESYKGYCSSDLSNASDVESMSSGTDSDGNGSTADSDSASSSNDRGEETSGNGEGTRSGADRASGKSQARGGEGHLSRRGQSSGANDPAMIEVLNAAAAGKRIGQKNGKDRSVQYEKGKKQKLERDAKIEREKQKEKERRRKTRAKEKKKARKRAADENEKQKRELEQQRQRQQGRQGNQNNSLIAAQRLTSHMKKLVKALTYVSRTSGCALTVRTAPSVLVFDPILRAEAVEELRNLAFNYRIAASDLLAFVLSILGRRGSVTDQARRLMNAALDGLFRPLLKLSTAGLGTTSVVFSHYRFAAHVVLSNLAMALQSRLAYTSWEILPAVLSNLWFAIGPRTMEALRMRIMVEQQESARKRQQRLRHNNITASYHSSSSSCVDFGGCDALYGDGRSVRRQPPVRANAFNLWSTYGGPQHQPSLPHDNRREEVTLTKPSLGAQRDALSSKIWEQVGPSSALANIQVNIEPSRLVLSLSSVVTHVGGRTAQANSRGSFSGSSRSAPYFLDIPIDCLSSTALPARSDERDLRILQAEASTLFQLGYNCLNSFSRRYCRELTRFCSTREAWSGHPEFAAQIFKITTQALERRPERMGFVVCRYLCEEALPEVSGVTPNGFGFLMPRPSATSHHTASIDPLLPPFTPPMMVDRSALCGVLMAIRASLQHVPMVGFRPRTVFELIRRLLARHVLYADPYADAEGDAEEEETNSVYERGEEVTTNWGATVDSGGTGGDGDEDDGSAGTMFGEDSGSQREAATEATVFSSEGIRDSTAAVGSPLLTRSSNKRAPQPRQERGRGEKGPKSSPRGFRRHSSQRPTAAPFEELILLFRVLVARVREEEQPKIQLVSHTTGSISRYGMRRGPARDPFSSTVGGGIGGGIFVGKRAGDSRGGLLINDAAADDDDHSVLTSLFGEDREGAESLLLMRSVMRWRRVDDTIVQSGLSRYVKHVANLLQTANKTRAEEGRSQESPNVPSPSHSPIASPANADSDVHASLYGCECTRLSPPVPPTRHPLLVSHLDGGSARGGGEEEGARKDTEGRDEDAEKTWYRIRSVLGANSLGAPNLTSNNLRYFCNALIERAERLARSIGEGEAIGRVAARSSGRDSRLATDTSDKKQEANAPSHRGDVDKGTAVNKPASFAEAKPAQSDGDASKDKSQYNGAPIDRKEQTRLTAIRGSVTTKRGAVIVNTVSREAKEEEKGEDEERAAGNEESGLTGTAEARVGDADHNFHCKDTDNCSYPYPDPGANASPRTMLCGILEALSELAPMMRRDSALRALEEEKRVQKQQDQLRQRRRREERESVYDGYKGVDAEEKVDCNYDLISDPGEWESGALTGGGEAKALSQRFLELLAPIIVSFGCWTDFASVGELIATHTRSEEDNAFHAGQRLRRAQRGGGGGVIGKKSSSFSSHTMSSSDLLLSSSASIRSSTMRDERFSSYGAGVSDRKELRARCLSPPSFSFPSWTHYVDSIIAFRHHTRGLKKSRGRGVLQNNSLLRAVENPDDLPPQSGQAPLLSFPTTSNPTGDNFLLWDSAMRALTAFLKPSREEELLTNPLAKARLDEDAAERVRQIRLYAALHKIVEETVKSGSEGCSASNEEETSSTTDPKELHNKILSSSIPAGTCRSHTERFLMSPHDHQLVLELMSVLLSLNSRQLLHDEFKSDKCGLSSDGLHGHDGEFTFRNSSREGTGYLHSGSEMNKGKRRGALLGFDEFGSPLVSPSSYSSSKLPILVKLARTRRIFEAANVVAERHTPRSLALAASLVAGYVDLVRDEGLPFIVPFLFSLQCMAAENTHRLAVPVEDQQGRGNTDKAFLRVATSLTEKGGPRQVSCDASSSVSSPLSSASSSPPDRRQQSSQQDEGEDTASDLMTARSAPYAEIGGTNKNVNSTPSASFLASGGIGSAILLPPGSVSALCHCLHHVVVALLHHVALVLGSEPMAKYAYAIFQKREESSPCEFGPWFRPRVASSLTPSHSGLEPVYEMEDEVLAEAIGHDVSIIMDHKVVMSHLLELARVRESVLSAIVATRKEHKVDGEHRGDEEEKCGENVARNGKIDQAPVPCPSAGSENRSGRNSSGVDFVLSYMRRTSIIKCPTEALEEFSKQCFGACLLLHALLSSAHDPIPFQTDCFDAVLHDVRCYACHRLADRPLLMCVKLLLGRLVNVSSDTVMRGDKADDMPTRESVMEQNAHVGMSDTGNEKSKGPCTSLVACVSSSVTRLTAGALEKLESMSMPTPKASRFVSRVEPDPIMVEYGGTHQHTKRVDNSAKIRSPYLSRNPIDTTFPTLPTGQIDKRDEETADGEGGGDDRADEFSAPERRNSSGVCSDSGIFSSLSSAELSPRRYLGGEGQVSNKNDNTGRIGIIHANEGASFVNAEKTLVSSTPAADKKKDDIEGGSAGAVSKPPLSIHHTDPYVNITLSPNPLIGLHDRDEVGLSSLRYSEEQHDAHRASPRGDYPPTSSYSKRNLMVEFCRDPFFETRQTRPYSRRGAVPPFFIILGGPAWWSCDTHHTHKGGGLTSPFSSDYKYTKPTVSTVCMPSPLTIILDVLAQLSRIASLRRRVDIGAHSVGYLANQTVGGVIEPNGTRQMERDTYTHFDRIQSGSGGGHHRLGRRKRAEEKETTHPHHYASTPSILRVTSASMCARVAGMLTSLFETTTESLGHLDASLGRAVCTLTVNARGHTGRGSSFLLDTTADASYPLSRPAASVGSPFRPQQIVTGIISAVRRRALLQHPPSLRILNALEKRRHCLRMLASSSQRGGADGDQHIRAGHSDCKKAEQASRETVGTGSDAARADISTTRASSARSMLEALLGGDGRLYFAPVVEASGGTFSLFLANRETALQGGYLAYTTTMSANALAGAAVFSGSGVGCGNNNGSAFICPSDGGISLVMASDGRNDDRATCTSSPAAGSVSLLLSLLRQLMGSGISSVALGGSVPLSSPTTGAERKRNTSSAGKGLFLYMRSPTNKKGRGRGIRNGVRNGYYASAMLPAVSLFLVDPLLLMDSLAAADALSEEYMYAINGTTNNAAIKTGQEDEGRPALLGESVTADGKGGYTRSGKGVGVSPSSKERRPAPLQGMDKGMVSMIAAMMGGVSDRGMPIPSSSSSSSSSPLARLLLRLAEFYQSGRRHHYQHPELLISSFGLATMAGGGRGASDDARHAFSRNTQRVYGETAEDEESEEQQQQQELLLLSSLSLVASGGRGKGSVSDIIPVSSSAVRYGSMLFATCGFSRPLLLNECATASSLTLPDFGARGGGSSVSILNPIPPHQLGPNNDNSRGVRGEEMHVAPPSTVSAVSGATRSYPATPSSWSALQPLNVSISCSEAAGVGGTERAHRGAAATNENGLTTKRFNHNARLPASWDKNRIAPNTQMPKSTLYVSGPMRSANVNASASAWGAKAFAGSNASCLSPLRPPSPSLPPVTMGVSVPLNRQSQHARRLAAVVSPEGGRGLGESFLGGGSFAGGVAGGCANPQGNTSAMRLGGSWQSRAGNGLLGSANASYSSLRHSVVSSSSRGCPPLPPPGFSPRASPQQQQQRSPSSTSLSLAMPPQPPSNRDGDNTSSNPHPQPTNTYIDPRDARRTLRGPNVMTHFES